MYNDLKPIFLLLFSLGLLWQVTKGDIEETLKHVCKKVLQDHSVTAHTRHRRAEALLLLGEQYVLHRVRDLDGIHDFLERIGKQTGIFTDDAPAFNPFGADPTAPADDKSASTAGKNNSQPGGSSSGGFATPGDTFFSDSVSKDMLLEIQRDLSQYSIKELKDRIVKVGGDHTHCLEKEDLRRYLEELVAIRLAVLETSS